MERGEKNACFNGYRRPPPTPTSSRNILNMNNNNNNNGTNHNDDSNNNNECVIREQDRFMPIANIIRIMRKILPPHAKISDDAKETIQECVSEYISFITGEANERCQREQRKTITAEDVLWAMSKLGFDDYIEPLTLFLNKYRDIEGDRGTMNISTRGTTSTDPSVRRTVVSGDPNMGYNVGPTFVHPPMVGGFHYFGAHPSGQMIGGGYMKEGVPIMGNSSQAMGDHHIELNQYGQGQGGNNKM